MKTPVVVAVIVGVLAEAGWPAQEAMVADLLPEEKRADGYGIIRVVFNLSVVIAPILGGLLAVRSYQLLFVADALTSAVTALAAFGFGWVVAGVAGPLMAGRLLDSGNPNWLWYATLGLGLASAGMFVYLRTVDRQRRLRIAAAASAVVGAT